MPDLNPRLSDAGNDVTSALPYADPKVPGSSLGSYIYLWIPNSAYCDEAVTSPLQSLHLMMVRPQQPTQPIRTAVLMLVRSCYHTG